MAVLRSPKFYTICFIQFHFTIRIFIRRSNNKYVLLTNIDGKNLEIDASLYNGHLLVETLDTLV